MSQIPRIAPSGLGDPFAVPRAPRQAKPKAGVPFAGPDPKHSKHTKSKNPMTEKLNMKKWDFDPDEILKQLNTQEGKNES